jgi:hypothetical protein
MDIQGQQEYEVDMVLDCKLDKRRKEQAPVEHQLMVALMRLGTYGNGTAILTTSAQYAISGKLSTKRVGVR